MRPLLFQGTCLLRVFARMPNLIGLECQQLSPLNKSLPDRFTEGSSGHAGPDGVISTLLFLSRSPFPISLFSARRYNLPPIRREAFGTAGRFGSISSRAGANIRETA